jgi:hypothetical protein
VRKQSKDGTNRTASDESRQEVTRKREKRVERAEHTEKRKREPIKT